ncbi:MAG TPA: nitroreductase family deazaflavin-dependent oxidoreductase [Gaiellaceae bacterium]
MRKSLIPVVTRTMGALHRTLYRLSGGRIGGSAWGLPIVLLTTTGRRSGKQRTTPLCALPHGDDYVVVGSFGGMDRHPAWWLNLEAQPQAGLQVGRRRHGVTARLASPDERGALWSELTARAPGYLDYERRTEREIPVVILHPD